MMGHPAPTDPDILHSCLGLHKSGLHKSQPHKSQLLEEISFPSCKISNGETMCFEKLIARTDIT